jgi:hypothetical protein
MGLNHFLDLGIENSGTVIERLGRCAHQEKNVNKHGSTGVYQNRV